MERETSNNELNQSPVSGAEANQSNESPIVEESKIQEEPKKLSLSDINPADLTEKIESFFSDKLQTMESKYQNDLVIVEPFKFEFIDLYHDLENLQQEILDFLKKEEDRKSNLKKPAGGAGAITRNNTSRSRTPIKFNATKIASTRDVTKSANLKGDLDKSRSRTPLTASKPNSKTTKDVSVAKTETKKTLNTTANVASTLNTTRVANTAKKPGIADSSAKKRDMTPVSSTKAGKILDTSGISHNDPAHTEHGNTTAKNSKANKTGIKGEAKANVASAILKKPANENANVSNGSKKKSALNLTSGAGAEGHPAVSSFNSSLDLTAKKKSVLAGGLNAGLNSDVSANYSSNNNLGESNNINNNGSNTGRASINKGIGKGERKSSLPSQRVSLSGTKRNSVEGKKENLNGSVDDKRDNNAEKTIEDNSKNVIEKRKSIEVKKIDVESHHDSNLISDNEKRISEEDKKENVEVSLIANNINVENENNVVKANKNARNETRKSINEMVFENQWEKQEEAIKEEKANSDNTNNNLSQNAPVEKRQSIKQEIQDKKTDNLDVSEKAENDLKVTEERKKSVLAESLSNAASVSAEVKIQEGSKDENTEGKGLNEIKFTEAAEVPKLSANTEAKNSNGGFNKNLLLSFSNKKSCALHLLIKSGLLTIQEQIRAVYCNKELVSNHLSEIKEDLFIFLKDKIAEYEALNSKYKTDIANVTIINKQLSFSKTAANGLNFVKKEEENGLLKKEQNEKIVDVFKFFCILLNENWETLPSNKIIEFFISTVLPKFKIESLRKFVSEYIPANILNFDIQLEKLLDFVSKHHHILVSNELLSLNRSVSYVTFSNKEVFEYLSAKLSDGNYAYYNRRANCLIKKYNEILNKLGH